MTGSHELRHINARNYIGEREVKRLANGVGGDATSGGDDRSSLCFPCAVMARLIGFHAGTNGWTLCPGSCLQPGQKVCQQAVKGLKPFCLGWSLQPGQKTIKNSDKRPRSFSVISGRRGQPICPGSRLSQDKRAGRKPSFLLVNLQLVLDARRVSQSLQNIIYIIETSVKTNKFF